MRLNQLLKTDFTLTDARTGNPLTFDFVSKPAAIGFERSTIIHLSVMWWPHGHQPMPEKGILTLKANAFDLLPDDLVVRDIPLDTARTKK